MNLVPFDPDHVGCCINPVFVEEVVGHYTRRVVVDRAPVAKFQSVDALPDMTPTTHVEILPTPIPRTAQILRWREIR